jgi:pimeloyl-ACP methyl ester carboxylesterase
LRGRVAAVLSVGGHGDLPRTLRYLCSGELPDGTHRAPHDYGLAIVLLEVADQLVPPGQVDALRSGVRTFLRASHVDATDRWRARPIFEEALRMERAMPEPAAGLLRLVNRRTVEALGRVLRPHVASRGADPALSPERSPAPRAPVFLLHGASDNVIPALESRLLARHLEGRTRVELLLTPLMTHAEARAAADLSELWKAVSFWAAVLQE